MIKKITSLCIALLLVFLTIPTYAQAAEKKLITSDTIITEDNIYDVLDYLGIDPKNLVSSDNIESSVYTVGELETAINQAYEIDGMNKEKYKEKHIKMNSNFYTDAQGNTTDTVTTSSANTMLYRTDYQSLCEIEYSVSVGYIPAYWSGTYEQVYHPATFTGVYGGWTSIDSYPFGTTKRLSVNGGSLSYTPSTVTYYTDYTVQTFIGVSDLTLIYLYSNRYYVTNYWYAN